MKTENLEVSYPPKVYKQTGDIKRKSYLGIQLSTYVTSFLLQWYLKHHARPAESVKTNIIYLWSTYIFICYPGEIELLSEPAITCSK